ncbi:MAG: DUF1577 domain-containing protein [Spirochaetota bacterium]
MKEVKQRRQRILESVSTLDDIMELLKDEQFQKRLAIKYSIEKSTIEINEFIDERTIMLVTDPDYVPINNKIILYGLIDRYIEIECDVIEATGPGYFKCKVKSARKAAQGRRDLRFKMNPEKVVATNFRVSKHTIDIRNYSIPTGIKVIIEQFENQISKNADIVKVDIFDDRDTVLAQIKKTRSTLYIEDLTNPATFVPINEAFIDIKEVLHDQTSQYIKKLTDSGYKSIIISPVIYIEDDERLIPFAYIQYISKDKPLSMDKVLEIQDLAFKLVDRIRDANTLMIAVHQEIEDISRGGAKLKITDSNLKKYILKSKGFIFDIVFKLQAPITIYGDIRYTFIDSEDNLIIGVDFAGNSSRKDEMKRFYSIIQPMEVEYRNRLIKEMRQKKKAQD